MERESSKEILQAYQARETGDSQTKLNTSRSLQGRKEFPYKQQ